MMLRLLLALLVPLCLATSAIALDGVVGVNHPAKVSDVATPDKVAGVTGLATGGASFSAADNFDRADSNTLGALSGGTYTWSEGFGDLDIETNRAGLGTAGTAGAVIGANRATGYVQSTCNAEGSASSQPGVIFWYVDSSNYWYACLDPDDPGGNDIELHQVSGGTDTEMADAAFTAVVTTTYTLRVTFGAASVVVNVNSSNYITHSGSFGANSGDVGIIQNRGGGATGWNDAFAAGE
jgi:hypothetical protein